MKFRAPDLFIMKVPEKPSSRSRKSRAPRKRTAELPPPPPKRPRASAAPKEPRASASRQNPGPSHRSARTTERPETSRNETTQKTRRYRPGTRALMEIRKYQRTTDQLIQRAPFARLVREICLKYTGGVTFLWQSMALKALQEASEFFLVDLFQHAYLCRGHAKRVTSKLWGSVETCLSRTSGVLIDQLQLHLEGDTPKEDIIAGLPILKIATNFLADASAESVRFCPHCFPVKYFKIKSRTEDVTSKNKLAVLPFHGQFVFGADLDNILAIASDNKKGFPKEKAQLKKTPFSPPFSN
ncbi:uncharacterized protein LOC130358402 [Hyla sarda]|uniref:uncharacterized protein LOC130358402 n=1 Tax=Hyla sarda TaxID=327740 RepID=UPI0024C3F6B3|nr:uncharacterized protein LOC130358402 [Hyla sarda]